MLFCCLISCLNPLNDNDDNDDNNNNNNNNNRKKGGNSGASEHASWKDYTGKGCDCTNTHHTGKGGHETLRIKPRGRVACTYV